MTRNDFHWWFVTIKHCLRWLYFRHVPTSMDASLQFIYIFLLNGVLYDVSYFNNRNLLKSGPYLKPQSEVCSQTLSVNARILTLKKEKQRNTCFPFDMLKWATRKKHLLRRRANFTVIMETPIIMGQREFFHHPLEKGKCNHTLQLPQAREIVLFFLKSVVTLK